jgi:hypothetical protein
VPELALQEGASLTGLPQGRAWVLQPGEAANLVLALELRLVQEPGPVWPAAAQFSEPVPELRATAAEFLRLREQEQEQEQEQVPARRPRP